MVAGAACAFVTYWAGALLASAVALSRQPVAGLPAQALRPFLAVTAWEVALVTAGAALGLAVARYRWRLAGVAGYVALLSLIVGYLAYSLTVTIPAVPPGERWLSYTLLAAEGGGLGLIVVFSFYSLDAGTRRRWARVAAASPFDAKARPVVAFEVPVFNEPFPMVRETILHLMRQDYPRDRFLVVVADDSTDVATRAALASLCATLGVTYSSREGRRGFKAGALNHATSRLPAEVQLIAVIDADYWVDPDYLRSVVGYFADPSLSFVQTPQDYRNLDESFLTRQYKRAESYFYHAIMPSRNESSAIIFCGTMGILRRDALLGVGGFAEDQICEDAEVSVRLAAAGWDSLYLDRSFGKGLMPAVFDAYKKQFHRWSFGNVRILRSRTWRILRSRSMTLRQKADFLVSNLHWFDGLFVLTIAGVLLTLGLAPLFDYDVVTHHQQELALLAFVPLFLVVDGVVRLRGVLGRAGRTSLGQALLVQGMWFSIKLTNLLAAMKCLLGFRSPFVRTPKDPGHRLGRWRSFWRALRITKLESLIGVVLLATAGYNVVLAIARLGAHVGTVLLPVWLAMYALFFLCAPLYAYLSYRTLRPVVHMMTAPGATRPAAGAASARAPARPPPTAQPAASFIVVARPTAPRPAQAPLPGFTYAVARLASPAPASARAASMQPPEGGPAPESR